MGDRSRLPKIFEKFYGKAASGLRDETSHSGKGSRVAGSIRADRSRVVDRALCNRNWVSCLCNGPRGDARGHYVVRCQSRLVGGGNDLRGLVSGFARQLGELRRFSIMAKKSTTTWNCLETAVRPPHPFRSDRSLGQSICRIMAIRFAIETSGSWKRILSPVFGRRVPSYRTELAYEDEYEEHPEQADAPKNSVGLVSRGDITSRPR